MNYFQQGAHLVAQSVKNLPAMQKAACNTGEPDSISGSEGPLEKKIAPNSSILAWKIPWTTVHGVAKRQTQLSNFHFTSLQSH